MRDILEHMRVLGVKNFLYSFFGLSERLSVLVLLFFFI